MCKKLLSYQSSVLGYGDGLSHGPCNHVGFNSEAPKNCTRRNNSVTQCSCHWCRKRVTMANYLVGAEKTIEMWIETPAVVRECNGRTLGAPKG